MHVFRIESFYNILFFYADTTCVYLFGNYFFCIYPQLFFIVTSPSLVLSSKEINGGNVPEDAQSCKNKISQEKRQQTVNLAKSGVRNRRSRRMQASN